MVRRWWRGINGFSPSTWAIIRWDVKSLVEVGLNVSIVHIGLVIPGETGVNDLGQFFTLDGCNCSLDSFVSNLDWSLSHSAGLHAAANGFELCLTGVDTNHLNLAGVAGFGHTLHRADG